MAAQIPTTEQQSKYEKYGKFIRDCLNREIQSPNKETELYDHQIEAVQATQAYLENQRDHPALLVAPTGAGKSGIIALLPYALDSKKVVILSPSKKITDQLEIQFGLKDNNVLKSFLFERGVVSEADLNRVLETGCVIRNTLEPGNMKWHNLVISNAQKFSSNTRARLSAPPAPESGDEEEEAEHERIKKRILKIKENFKAFSTLIVDEAHHFPAKTWDLIVQEFREEQVVFLTATPYRGREAKPLWKGQAITYQISIPRLIQLHILRPLEYGNVSIEGWAKGQLTAGHYRAFADEIMTRLQIHDELVPGVEHKAMVLVSTIDETIAGAEAMGDKATWYTSEDGCEKNFRAFEKGHKRIILVCGRLLEGYDNNTVSVCAILRNVGTLGTFTQFVGRCVRTSQKDGSDTVKAVVLSHQRFRQEEMFKEYKRMNGITEM